ncbi:MAG: YtxH domain-containing protein [Anaerolineae bacterium]|nr:YtxH domain-containing protein [Anaerolineae bacterium]
MSENNSDFGAFLAGFVIGGLVGAATALILAPQSGEQTRDQISSKSGEWRETGGQRVQQYRDLSTEKIHEYQDRASYLLNRDKEEDETNEEISRIVLDDGNAEGAEAEGEDSTDSA